LIVEDYFKLERHKVGKTESADSYLFDAKDLTNFAVPWMETNFREHYQTLWVGPLCGWWLFGMGVM